MIRFSDYIWERVRGGILFFWFFLTAISVVSYTSVVVYLKNRQLKSSLSVAAFTVHESVSAGDWTLALGHLKALEKSGPVFRIQLKNKSGGSNVTGPFGEKQFGVGSLCSEAPVGNPLVLSGCMRIFGIAELYTAFLLLLLAGAVFFAAFMLFRSKMLTFIGQVSGELGRMRALGRGKPANQNMENPQSSIAEIASIRDYISGLLQETEKASEAQARNQLSAQVAHDIRSPLTALNMAAEDLHALPESQRILIRSAVTRIQDIANSLMPQNTERTSSLVASREGVAARSGLSNQLLSSLVDSIVSEKRVQYRSRLGIEIKGIVDASSYGLFAQVDPSEFKRVLSNLINNAVEAISKDGRVDVCLSGANDGVTLLVRDTGKGISPDVLPHLMEKGATFGKDGGSGLGLYHARTTVQGWSGDIGIESHLGHGTTVRITLKKAPPPEWFVPHLRLENASIVVILDDDISIHQIWQKRIDELQIPGLDVRHLSTIEEIREWHRESHPRGRRTHYLIDYELLGEKLNGLQIIESLDIAEDSILVTSRYEESNLVAECLRLGVGLIPKALAAFVPLTVISREEFPVDGVLIDDDAIVRMNWRHAAKKQGKVLRTFGSPSAFMTFADFLPRATPIYIDSHLGNGLQGELVAQEIYERGFVNIFLTTGYSPSRFSALPWLKGIVDKRPPWRIAGQDPN